MDKTTFKRSFKLSVAVGAVLLLAFGLASAREWWIRNHRPSREPDFRGRIVSQRGGEVLVESPQGGRCWFYPPVSAHVRTRSDELGALSVGPTVSVWSTGPVRLSYPPGADTIWIVIEEEPQAPQ